MFISTESYFKTDSTVNSTAQINQTTIDEYITEHLYGGTTVVVQNRNLKFGSV